MIVACTECGQKNRIPGSHLHRRGTCGKCSEALGPSEAPVDVGSISEFDEIVQGARVPVLVDFWAPWCAPCRMVAPVVKLTAKKHRGKALVLKVDTDQLPELGTRYQVRGIPNFAVFRDGELKHQQAGAVDLDSLTSWLAAA